MNEFFTVLLARAVGVLVSLAIFFVGFLAIRWLQRKFSKPDGDFTVVATIGLMVTVIGGGFLCLLGAGWVANTILYGHIELADESQQRLSEIESESERIRDTLSSLDELSVPEIRKSLNDALSFTEQLEAETREKERALTSLKQKIKAEQERADTLQNITDEEADALTLLITNDAARQSRNAFWLGLACSIPIGLGTSVCGNWIWSRRKNRQAQMPTNQDRSNGGLGEEQ